MGEYLSRSGYIGKGVGEVIAQHQNFSQATWYCRRLEEAISCLKPAPKLTANGKEIYTLFLGTKIQLVFNLIYHAELN